MRTRAILVVDEDAAAWTTTVATLSRAGYRVASARGFEEAKALLSVIEAPDLLITELRLGAFNGLHLIIRTRVSRPDMAAIIVTGFSDPVLKVEANRLGVAYLVKPPNPAELLPLVSRVAPLS